MAVAPIDQVRRVLDYAVSVIPRDKIYLGIPNYGYDWVLPFVSGESKARSIGNVEALELAARYKAEILFDEIAMSPYFYYTDDWNQRHVVWFEDARSIYAKLLLLTEYKLLGPAYWNLMRPFPQNSTLLEQLFTIEKG